MQTEDFRTAAWKRLTKHLQQRLQELRELNDGQHDATRTSEIRGSIKEVKRILDLADTASSSATVHTGIPPGVDESL